MTFKNKKEWKESERIGLGLFNLMFKRHHISNQDQDAALRGNGLKPCHYDRS